MNLPGGLGTIEWRDWTYGLIGAFISGGAGALTSGVVVALADPEHYNVSSGKLFTLMGIMFLAHGILGAALFLHQRPLPTITTTVKTLEQTTQTHKPDVTTVTKIEETTVERKPD